MDELVGNTGRIQTLRLSHDISQLVALRLRPFSELSVPPGFRESSTMSVRFPFPTLN